MTFIVATNVVASRPAERGPTGTPHTRAKRFSSKFQGGFKSVDRSFVRKLLAWQSLQLTEKREGLFLF